MKRSGFTMIELVFVIVILGILASVAIPKLAATRDDAMIAKAQSEISSMIQDLGSYYTAHGELDTTIGKMTNVPLYKNDATTLQNTVTYVGGVATTYYVDTKRNKKCLDVTLNDTNGTVTLKKGSDSSIFCDGLVAALKENGLLNSAGDGEKTYSFGGSSIYGTN